jgi:hypothetical protein
MIDRKHISILCLIVIGSGLGWGLINRTQIFHRPSPEEGGRSENLQMERTEPEKDAAFQRKMEQYGSGVDIAHDRAELYAEAEEVLHMATKAMTMYEGNTVQVSNIAMMVIPATGLWLGPGGPEEHRKVAAIKAQLEALMKAKQESK